MAEIMKLKDFESLPMREREAIMEAGAKLSKDPTDAMSLADIRDRDTDNLELTVFKDIRDVRFDNLNEAMAFIGECMRAALKKFGINLLDQVRASTMRGGKGFRSTEFMGKRLDVEMRKKGVKQEYREPQLYMKNRPEDVWKSGNYFYKGNEIAFFISNPMQVKYNRNGIQIPGRTEYLVRTNVPTPGKGGA